MLIDLKLIRRAVGAALSLMVMAMGMRMRIQHALIRACSGRMYPG